jgi:L-alanine-DL-glutamate epimerase-like enolase superfamily enzyme
MDIELTVEPITLNLKTPFRIAHGTSTSRESILVHLGSGVGEGAIMPYYGYTQAEMIAYVENLDFGSLFDGPCLILQDALDKLPPGPAPARNAVDMALHDLWAKQLGQPLYRLWGLNPNRLPFSSITIDIPEDEAELRQRVQAVKACPILKLKLGTGDLDVDEDIVRIVGEETNAQLVVDANSAYSVAEAARMVSRLAPYNLLFIEQPLGRSDNQDWHRLRSLLPAGAPPLIADESVQQVGDLFALAGGADGINIKLTKAGGLREARRMITVARALGMQVMLGCALESSVGITAAAHLAPLVDFADLDGHLYVANDPYAGARLEYGRLHLPAGPGLGVTRKFD